MTPANYSAKLVQCIDFLGAETCDQLVGEGFRSEAWRDSPVFVTDDHMLARKTQRTARLIGEGEAGSASLNDALRSVRQIIEAVPIVRSSGLTLSPIQFVRYPPGGFYRTHRDGFVGHSEWRKLSFVVYLNDNFEGGRTMFPELGVCIDPQKGHAVVFPPHYAHSAEAVAGGEKFILSFWLEDHCPRRQ